LDTEKESGLVVTEGIRPRSYLRGIKKGFEEVQGRTGDRLRWFHSMTNVEEQVTSLLMDDTSTGGRRKHYILEKRERD